MNKKYQPSNGECGRNFEAKFCHQCIHERWVHRMDEDRDEDKCEIYNAMIISDVMDKDYPMELTYDENGYPTCTKWQKWDWGNDNDGFNEPPEKPYEPQDPNQLMMFSIADDVLENHKPKTKVNA